MNKKKGRFGTTLNHKGQMIKDTKELWDSCVTFHGHECGGLWIGYKAALLASKILDLDRSEDEEIVCVSECDACSVDPISVILGCTIGKGNLLIRLTGKFAFSFYNRNTGKSVRLVLDTHDEGLSHEESTELYRNTPMEEMFMIKDANPEIPDKAHLYHSIPCDECKEYTAEAFIVDVKGRKLCKDCAASLA